MGLLEETKLILNKHGLRPKRYSGQNFLVDPAVLQRQVGYADVSNRESVLEVGPGVGNLTRYLVEKAGKVIAVEKDPELAVILRERFRGKDNLEVIEGDVMRTELPPFDKVVSNIPYSLSSPLTFLLLKKGFNKAVITYQKEFAERMVALPGSRSYSRLSVATYYRAHARILEVLPPEAFYPEPEVSSAIVELIPKDPHFQVHEEFFFEVLRALFTHRGKTVRSALIHSPFLHQDKGARKKILMKIDSNLLVKRVFNLLPEEIALLSKELQKVMG